MSTYALPVITPETLDCSTLIARESTAVGEAYLKAAAKGVISPKHRCLLKTVDQVDDIGALLGGVPENTVVLIVQKKTDDDSPYTFTINLGDTPDQVIDRSNPRSHLYSRNHRRSLTFNPPRRNTFKSIAKSVLPTLAPTRIQVTQLPTTTQCVPSKTAAHIKKGTVLLGVNEQYASGAIPICEAEKPDHIWLMFEVGADDQFEDIGKLYIGGLNFYPLLDNNPNPVDSIWRIRCYTGSIFFENNYFRLDTRSSVYLQCAHNTQESVYFEFQGNTVVGMGSAQSQEGLLVDLRNLDNHQNIADLSSNWFAGNIKSAIEVRLDNGSKVNIENNHIRPAISEFREVQYGLELHGPCSSVTEAKNAPEISVNGNYLQTQNTSLTLYGALNINIAGNQMKAAELISIHTYTDEGHSTIPAVKLSSPQTNSWFSDGVNCPVPDDQSYLQGNLNLVVKPSGKRCDLEF